MIPNKREVEPRVAEEPTFQKTLQGRDAVLIKTREEEEAVMRVEPMLNIQNGLLFPRPLRVRVPVIEAEESKQ
jgi:hypothetical protein